MASNWYGLVPRILTMLSLPAIPTPSAMKGLMELGHLNGPFGKLYELTHMFLVLRGDGQNA